MSRTYTKETVERSTIPVERDVTSKGDGYSVIVVKTVDEVLKLRSIWESLGPIPYAHIDYFLTMVTSRPNVLRPYVLLLSRKGSPETMLVGMVEDIPFECKIGYKVLFKPQVRSLTVLDGGILGDATRTNCRALISELTTALKQKEADIVKFQDMPVDADMYKAARNLPGFLSRDHFPSLDRRWVMTLPPTIDEFFKGRKRKKNLRRIERRLEREFPGNNSVKIFREKDSLDRLVTDAEFISRKTYQYVHGTGFVQNEETLRLMHHLAEENLLRAYVLYIEDAPSAFYVGFVHNDVLHLIYTGYDPGYKAFEIGTFLLLKMIEDSIKDPAIRDIDFMCGDYAYKSRFCDKSWQESSFYIFAPSLKGILINGLRFINGSAFMLGDRILKLIRLRDRYDKYKRERVLE